MSQLQSTLLLSKFTCHLFTDLQLTNKLSSMIIIYINIRIASNHSNYLYKIKYVEIDSSPDFLLGEHVQNILQELLVGT